MADTPKSDGAASSKKQAKAPSKTGKSEKLTPLKKGAVTRISSPGINEVSKVASGPAGHVRPTSKQSNHSEGKTSGDPKKMAAVGCVKIQHDITCKSTTDETVFSLRFSPDGKAFAAALGNGTVHCFSSAGVPQRVIRTHAQNKEDLPCTCVRWLPSTVKAVLVVACANGSVQLLDLSNGVVMQTIWETPNEVLAVDCAPDGSTFASAGNDRIVRVYDASTMQVNQELQSGLDFAGTVTAGHSNRIYSALFASPTTLLTAGWDKTIQVYDLRTGRAARTLYGPKVSGDGLDVRKTTVIAASCDGSNQLQMFDYASGKEFPPEALSQPFGSSYLYSCKFNPPGTQIWACGTQPSILLGLDRQKGTVAGRLTDAPRSLFCLDMSPDGRALIVGGSHLGITLLSI